MYSRAFKFHRPIGLDGDIAPTDIEVIRSKAKVRRITFVTKWFPLIILRTGYHRAFIFQFANLSWLGLTPINFVFRGRVNVTRVTFVNKGFRSVSYFTC